MNRAFQAPALKIFFLFSLFIAEFGFASPVNKENSDKAVRGWLNRNSSPMGIRISKKHGKSDVISDANGMVLYYLVNLQPQGFVILSADDEIEPVIAFSATGYYDGSQNSPLKEILDRDMHWRLKNLGQQKVNRAAEKQNQKYKWQTLLDSGSLNQSKDSNEVELLGLSYVTDIRVPPLLQSKWAQGNAAGGYCYNYYTPNHYPTGCVATAMAQVMRYHSWPVNGIGVHSFKIYVDEVEQYWNTRGGNGSGGAYNWSQMPYEPQAGLTSTQREAIGALCYDAGVSVGTGYTESNSGASTATANQVFVGIFGFSNSVFGDNFSSSGDFGLWDMMNAGLDANLPVILGVSGPGVGHAVVADGYGYTSGTMYHHLNMGWGGLDDAWYQLPAIDIDIYFNAITDCVYNIYPSGTGEIVGGRVTNLAGVPLAAVAITAYQGTSVSAQAATNSRGIYALKNLPSNTQYRISAIKSGYAFTDQMVSSGFSQNWNATSGNKWGINFTSTNASPPTAISKSVDCNSTISKSITLEALDDHLPNPPASITYIITSLPLHGTLSENGVGSITNVPYAMSGSNNIVVYTPCQYFGGQDNFSFKANDGGTAPSGGYSNIATVTLNVDNKLYNEFGTSGTISTNTMIQTNNYASRSQVLYLHGDIGGGKYITDLAINFAYIPPIPLKQWTIRMQHTNKSQYTDVVGDFLTTGWTIVYQSDVTVSQTGWYNFHFSTPFHYNGAQNLLIDFSFNNNIISQAQTGFYIYYDVGDIDRIITIVTDQAVHSNPLDWDFWAGGGSYWGGGWLPRIKLIGTVPIEPIIGDFDLSCDVKLPDFAILASTWMTRQGDTNYNASCDIYNPKDNKVNLKDLSVFASHWLESYHP